MFDSRLGNDFMYLPLKLLEYKKIQSFNIYFICIKYQTDGGKEFHNI